MNGENSTPITPSVSPKSILILGILSLVFCETGIIGLILACIALNKAKVFKAETGAVTGAAKIGKILATIGYIFSLITVIVAVIAVLVVVIGVLVGGSLFGDFAGSLMIL